MDRDGGIIFTAETQRPQRKQPTKAASLLSLRLCGEYYRTNLVHNDDMNRAVRQSITLPADVAAQVRRLAKARRLSSSRMLLELIENGMEAEKRKQQEFFDLAERFRNAKDPEEVKRLGEQMGRMVFGG